MDNVINDRVKLRKTMDGLYETGKRRGKKEADAELLDLLKASEIASNAQSEEIALLKMDCKELSEALSAIRNKVKAFCKDCTGECNLGPGNACILFEAVNWE